MENGPQGEGTQGFTGKIDGSEAEDKENVNRMNFTFVRVINIWQKSTYKLHRYT